MPKPGLAIIENAFLPSAEITSTEDFSGRRDAIVQCYNALIARGSNIAIVGNRGIGKTSLARQVENIATGSVDLIERYGIDGGEALDFLVTYYACGSGVRNVDELLVRLLGVQRGLGNWIYSTPRSRLIMNTLSPSLRAQISGYGLDLGAPFTRSEQVTHEFIAVPNTIQGVFENILNNIVFPDAQAPTPAKVLLIIIDEFDQISDRTGFASLLKALATNVPEVKFCLVGVAKDIQDLMSEHPSADRLFAGSVISLPKMSREEILSIIATAEEKVDRYFKFDEEAKERIVDLASGHPYLAHLIGKFSFRRANSEGASVIDLSMIERVTESIAINQEDPALEGRYRKAVVSSTQREIVLKALAEHQDPQGEIWTTKAYASASEQGIINASQYVGQLVKADFGAEIEKVRDRSYRFKDSLFSAYVRARPIIRNKGASK